MPKEKDFPQQKGKLISKAIEKKIKDQEKRKYIYNHQRKNIFWNKTHMLRMETSPTK